MYVEKHGFDFPFFMEVLPAWNRQVSLLKNDGSRYGKPTKHPWKWIIGIPLLGVYPISLYPLVMTNIAMV